MRAAETNHARRRETATVVERHAVTTCPDCGNRLGGVHVGRRRQVVEVPPPPAVVVREHEIERGWCAQCQRWREAPLDLHGQVVGQGRLGSGVASLVAYLRTTLRLPIRSIQRGLADLHGLRLSVGAIADLLRRVAQHGASAVTAIRDTARTRTVVHADETSWRENGQNGYAWLLATPEGERYVEYHHSRAGAVAQALLGEAFRGVLVSDFYGGYNDTPGGRHQRCWVHLLRDARTLRDTHADDLSFQGRETHVWASALLTLGQQVRAVVRRPPPTDAGRQTQLKRLRADLDALAFPFPTTQGHPCKALTWRLRRFADELLTCLAQSGVPPDNNFAERAIRPLVVSRKISGGARSASGSATRMRLYSLAATWTAQGRSPLDEFRHLLQTPLPQV